MITVQKAIDALLTVKDKNLPLVISDTRSGVLEHPSIYGGDPNVVGKHDDGEAAEDLGQGGQYIAIYLG